jgi:tetratricopeptide (TPR) repeat protein
MIPKLLCGSCGNELSPQDKFCSNCGARVTLEGASEERKTPATVNCKLCGSENPVGAKYCSVCGAVLKSEASTPRPGGARREERKADGGRRQESAERKSEKQRTQPGRALSQGKIIAVFGGLLIVGVIVIGITRNQTKNVPVASTNQGTVSPTLVQDIEQLRKIVDTDSTNSGAILRLANLLHDGKFMDQAIIYYKKYLVLNEKDPDARVDLGICYFEQGDKDRAIAEMKRAITYAPKHQLAYFNLGIVTLSSGNMEEAASWFKKCIEVAPGTETARRAQELISQHTGAGTLKLN